MIPKFTHPQVKWIRTGEGILVFAFNAAMVVIPIITNALRPAEALKYAALLNMVAVASRSGLKAVTVFSALTNTKPAEIEGPSDKEMSSQTRELVEFLQNDVDILHERTSNVDTKIDALLQTFPDDLEWINRTVSDAEEFRVAPGEEPQL